MRDPKVHHEKLDERYKSNGEIRDGFRDAASAFGVTFVTGRRRALLGKSAAATSEFLRRSAP